MHMRILPLFAALFTFSVLPLHTDTAVKCGIKTISACPTIGCSKRGTPLAVTNSLKRTTTTNGEATVMSFGDLASLQKDVDSRFANGPIVIQGEKISSYRNMKAAARTIVLSGLKAGGGNFSEGDFVQLVGFIAATTLPPHPNKGETVNCKLTDEASNDYHINITRAKHGDETEGVVVEMIAN
jgi:hypothetical protein